MSIGKCFFWVFIILLGCNSSRNIQKDYKAKYSKPEKKDTVATDLGPAKFKFDSIYYHKGIVKQGEQLKFEIPFYNKGSEPLEIKLISACECTTIDWPVLPIPPGERRTLKISYDSRDKLGLQIVDLDIMANTQPANTFIKFQLFVEN